jgi:16S rRNA C967 or C1407 C5-methylase (RsmB/RsmF family)
MSSDSNPFESDWRECLGVHYMHVVREVASGAAPQHNADTLRSVLLRAGFSDSELDDLYIRATMRADDLPPDYLPEPPSAASVHAGVDLAPKDAAPAEPAAALEEGEATLPEAAAQIAAALIESEQPTRLEAPPVDPDPKPKQLSLF